jgi:DNA-binding response OmpR family regulator
MKNKDKILIVDDEVINLEFFSVMLSKLGFEVEQAESGEEALEKIKVNSPDLIILDNIMQGLTGWEVTKILKNEEEYKDFKNIPIIMFSAMDAVEDKIEGFELGIEDYITKPFNFSEVLARIRAVLRGKELAKQVSRREKRIAVIESLNNSLIFFTKHIKKPITNILEQAKKMSGSTPKAEINEIVKILKKESQEILATLGGLEEEIGELKNKESQLKEGDLTIEDLELKFKKHLLQNNVGAN